MNAFAALAPLRAKLTADQEALADELLDRLGDFRLERITTRALADEAEAWLTTRILALEEIRADELRRRPDDRDLDWLGASLDARFDAVHLLGLVRLNLAKLERAA